MEKSDLTIEQLNAVAEKFKQSPDGAKSFDEFFKRCTPEICGPAVMLRWCGMTVGIEKDGYAHT